MNAWRRLLALGRFTGPQLVAEGCDLAGVKANVAQAGREKWANSRPISSKTFLLPLPTASLARSTAAHGLQASHTSSRTSSVSLLAPMSCADVATSCTASLGAVFNTLSSVRARSSLRIVWPACLEAQVANVRPVGRGAGALRQRRRQLVVAVRNQQVAEDWIPGSRDPIDVADGGCARGIRAAHGILEMHRMITRLMGEGTRISGGVRCWRPAVIERFIAYNSSPSRFNESDLLLCSLARRCTHVPYDHSK